jgi:hypothetical protein
MSIVRTFIHKKLVSLTIELNAIFTITLDFHPLLSGSGFTGLEDFQNYTLYVKLDRDNRMYGN